METFEEKLHRVLAEEINIVPYNSQWPEMFEKEKRHLINCIPVGIIKRIEHFGSTAVPSLSAKPIVDILVEVTSLERTRQEIVPILEDQGYDYFWRSSTGSETPPFYAWFIGRDIFGNRTYHIHMLEKDFAFWDGLLFRDYLRENPQVAKEYEKLKLDLSKKYRQDREGYTKAKTNFIVKITELAKHITKYKTQ
jgi:GrpB-like predicted nucleotidyltransferase (UPF0157 family)